MRPDLVAVGATCRGGRAARLWWRKTPKSHRSGLIDLVTSTSASDAESVRGRSYMNRSYRIVPIALMVSGVFVALSQLDGFAAGGHTASKVLVVMGIVVFVWAATALVRAERDVRSSARE
jgi:hypothetical protein